MEGDGSFQSILVYFLVSLQKIHCNSECFGSRTTAKLDPKSLLSGREIEIS